MDILTLEDATNILRKRVQKIKDTEEVTLWGAHGRVLAEDITAQRNQPPFPRSPLDGYAVRSEDIKIASKESPVTLRVIDEVTAGHVSHQQVTKGAAVRIMTGAPIPDGADCIVMQEDTDYGEDTVEIYKEIKSYQNYCFEGEDYKSGDKLLSEGMRLDAVEIGVLASLGYEKMNVYRRPKIALFTTGDEIILPGEVLKDGKIYDSNLYTLGSRLLSWDMEVPIKERVSDEAQIVARKIEEISGDVDLIVTTGGVSVGKKDIMHEVLEILGAEKIFWKIAIKPGMPTLCASYQGKLLICLSGNPFGAAVNMDLLVRPILAKMTGRSDLKLKRRQAVTQSVFPKRSPVARYVRAYYEEGIVTIPNGPNDSGILSSMCGCNCLIEIPAGTEKVCEGDQVWVVML
ncbi:MAG: gephyrin-like molybdotransferase Glp [Dorea sp.]